MTRYMSGTIPIVVAVVSTVLFGSLFSLAQGNENLVLPVLGILGLMSLLEPYWVPVVWTWALLKGHPHQWVLVGLVIWLATAVVMMPGEVTWPMTTHVVMGLVAGFGLMLRWKPWVILLLLAVISLPQALWFLDQVPLAEVFEDQKEQVLQARQELLLAGTKEGDEPPSLVQEEQMLDDLFETVHRLFPGAVALSLLLQAAVTFGLVWVLIRVLGLAPVLRGFPPFVRWRLPFLVVWVLAAAVGLMIIPLPWWPAAGSNLVMVVTAMLAVQGAALQWHMSATGVPMLLRLFFAFMAGMLFLPLVLLGLADQWMDFRKLEIEGPADSGPAGPGNDPKVDQDTGGNDKHSASDADDDAL